MTLLKLILISLNTNRSAVIEALTKVGSISAALSNPGLSPREEVGARARFTGQRLKIDPMTNVEGAQLA